MSTVSIQLKISTDKIRMLLSGDITNITAYLATTYGNDSNITAQIGDAPGYACKPYGIVWDTQENYGLTKVEFWVPITDFDNESIMVMIGEILRPLNLSADEAPGKIFSVGDLRLREYVTVVPELTVAKDDALECVTRFIALSKTHRQKKAALPQLADPDKAIPSQSTPTPSRNCGVGTFGGPMAPSSMPVMFNRANAFFPPSGGHPAPTTIPTMITYAHQS